jgi:predicted Zn-dependent peptidase
MQMKYVLRIALGFLAYASFSGAQAQERISTWETRKTPDWEVTEYSGDPLKTRYYKMPNGLTLITSVNKEQPRVQTMIAVKTGSKNDPANNTGLAHYLEHMLFKGTDKYGTLNWEAEKKVLDEIDALYERYNQSSNEAERKSIYRLIDSASARAARLAVANEYDKMCQSIGAQGTNAFTSFEQTVYINDIPTNALHKWVELESERFRNPVLRLFHTELEAVYEEKNISLDNDMNEVYEKLLAGLFRNHNYGKQTTIGTVEHLKNPSLKAIREYYYKYYVPNNMAIIMVGDIDPDMCAEMVKSHFAWMQPKPVPVQPILPEMPRGKPEQIDVVGPEAEQLYIGFRVPGAGTREAMLARLTDLILNNSSAGLIDLNLVKQQKVLHAESMAEIEKDYGFFLLNGAPKEGQRLEEVRDLLLAQLDLIRQGKFDEEMLRAIILNEEISTIQSFKSNMGRSYMLMSAFTNDVAYHKVRNELYEMSKVTRQEIIDFVNEYLGVDRVEVYKRQGERPVVAKIEKPAISQVELNRDKQSTWTANWLADPMDTLRPEFIDYTKAIRFSEVNKVPLWYVKNESNRLFDLYYVFDIGRLHRKDLPFALNYLQFLGMEGMSNEALNKKFYALGCSWSVSSDDKQSYLSLSGPEEHFEDALRLLEQFIRAPKADEQALKDLVDRTRKQRSDNKLDKRQISQALGAYARYGKDNPFNYQLSEAELSALTSAQLLTSLRSLFSTKHRIFYYGSRDEAKLQAALTSIHKVPATFSPAPALKQFTEVPVTENKVWFAHYDMVQADIRWQRPAAMYDIKTVPVANLFNEYFGGGMGSVVFQTIRESKALAYSTYSSYVLPSEKDKPAQVIAFVGTQSDKLHEAIGSMQELLDKLPANEGQFELARQSVRKSIESERITETRLLFSFDALSRLGLNNDIRKDVYAQSTNLKLGDITAFHQANFSRKPYNISIVGSRDRIKAGDLARYGKVQEVPLDVLFGY